MFYNLTSFVSGLAQFENYVLQARLGEIENSIDDIAEKTAIEREMSWRKSFSTMTNDTMLHLHVRFSTKGIESDYAKRLSIEIKKRGI
jgi:hypothetical protein